MGEYADSVISGFMCSHCGQCFDGEHGHPVLCKDCFDSETEEERAGLPRATLKELGGW
jgi:Zn-dependent alcohol dehydrogenase